MAFKSQYTIPLYKYTKIPLGTLMKEIFGVEADKSFSVRAGDWEQHILTGTHYSVDIAASAFQSYFRLHELQF